MTSISISALAGAFALAASAAMAAPVTWTFDNATFDDGTSITGSFVYNANSNTFSDINVMSSLFTYSAVTADSDQNLATLVTKSSGDLTGEGSLVLEFFPSLSDAGGIAALVNLSSYEGTCRDATCSGSDLIAFRDVADNSSITGASSSVSAVPVPAALPLLAGGLGLLGLVRARRKSA